MITDSVCQGKIIIPGCSNVSIFHKGVMKMPIERFLDGSDIFNRRNTSNTDLFPFIGIGLDGSHC